MNTERFNHKTINDPVHGPIRLSKTEVEIINTPSFLRLRHLRQLGLSYLVFPGATHTRFAHSIGTLHIMSRLIEAICDDCKRQGLGKSEAPILDSKEQQKLRLAALLHDIGHYPLSHTTEGVFYKFHEETDSQKADFEEPDSQKADSEEPDADPNYLQTIADVTAYEEVKHEEFGKIVVKKRNDIKNILSKAGFDPIEIGKIFTKDRILEDGKHIPPLYSQLISSSLDADRLDYLLRDSYYTGVPYGHIDLNFIIGNLKFDNDEKLFAIDYKGIPCFEHYLIARYFLYNVTYHKTVVGLELMAKTLYYLMAKDKCAIGDFNELTSKIGKEEFFIEYNDSYFWNCLTKWNPKNNTYSQKLKAAFIKRTPLRLIFEERHLIDRNEKDVDNKFRILTKNNLNKHDGFKNTFEKFHIDSNNVIITSNKIEFESQPPLQDHKAKSDDDKGLFLGKVYENYQFKDLIDVEHSIIRELSQKTQHIRRLYFFNKDNIDINRKAFDKALRREFEIPA